VDVVVVGYFAGLVADFVQLPSKIPCCLTSLFPPERLDLLLDLIHFPFLCLHECCKCELTLNEDV